MKKNRNITVEGITFDKQILKACGENGVIRRAYFNADEKEVVATNGIILLIEKVENPIKQESGYFDLVIPKETKHTRKDYLKGNDILYQWIIERDSLSFPEYKRFFNDIGDEYQGKDVLKDSFEWVHSWNIAILNEDDWSLTSKSVQKYFYMPVINTVFDQKYFKIVKEFFDDINTATFYFDNSKAPLIIKQGNKSASFMPMNVELPSEYVKFEKKKAILIK